MEVDELAEAGVVGVAGHVHDGALVVAALRVEVGLLGHRGERVPDDVLELLVGWVDVGQVARVVDHLHCCARHREGECGLAGPRVADEDYPSLVLRKALGQLETICEILIALFHSLRYTILHSYLILLIFYKPT